MAMVEVSIEVLVAVVGFCVSGSTENTYSESSSVSSSWVSSRGSNDGDTGS